jgi:phosphate butyryltransferase
LAANFGEVVERVRSRGAVTVAVAAAEDREVLEALKLAADAGLAGAILVGDESKIRPLAEEAGLSGYRVVHETEPVLAARTAVRLVREGEAQVLMKGLVNSSDFMRAVLNAEAGLRTGRLLSHLAAFEVPGQKKLIFLSDGGINIAPGLEEKKQILENALQALAAMGYAEPKVGILTANEQVTPKMPATADAAAIVEAWKSGAFSVPCVVEGPVALDVAVSPEAARHKRIDSAITGDPDLFIVPNIESGNLCGKTLIHYARARMAGLVLGASAPVVMTSRAESAEGKRDSIALACLVGGAK